MIAELKEFITLSARPKVLFAWLLPCFLYCFHLEKSPVPKEGFRSLSVCTFRVTPNLG